MSKIKLVLVDDELTSRNTVKNFLEDNEIYEITADFSSGKAALEWLRKNDVDILLCDMQMPEMNGVELMRSVHIINEYLPIIAISGFDNFDYVRGSLINGAANYLLKHELTREGLLQVLDQVREKYRIIPEGKSVSHKSGYCIRDDNEFNPQRIREMAEEGRIDFSCQNIIPIAIGPDYGFPEGIKPSEYKHDVCKAVIDMLNQILREQYKYLIYYTKEEHLIVLISFVRECSTLLMINTVNNLINRLQRQIVRMIDITVTIAAGEVHAQMETAVEEGRFLNSLLEDKLYLGGNRIISASVAKKITYSREGLPENLWRQLQFEVQNNLTGCVEVLHDVLETMENQRFSRGKVYSICCALVDMLNETGPLEEKEKGAVLERLGEYEIFEDFRSEILGLYNQKILLKKGQEASYSPAISQAVDYIYKNYTSDISLEDCAGLTGSSYTYFSREFKKETGMRFVEFLNHQRVNKAKSLLIRQNIPMKKIAELSGFRNYNYFFKVFKEMEGVTPSEFLSKK